MTIEIRALASADWDQWLATLELGFGGVPVSAEQRELWRELFDTGRPVGAWEDGEVVGTAGAVAFRLTVPGGAAVAAAGVTTVSVPPTHRRRGILRSMMRRQLSDFRSWGEPLAILVASEPAIYGRFGYGGATRSLSAEIDTNLVRPAVPAGTDDIRLRLRPADTDEARAVCESVYARRVGARPGMLARQPGWDRQVTFDPESRREGASPLQCVLAEAGGETVGYARYAVRPGWTPAGPDGTVLLRDIEALTSAAYAALWRYLFGIDLTTRISVQSRPVDDALLHLVSDDRRCRLGVRDSLFVRLVDVGAALAARTYQTPVDVVLDVADPFCPWNEGRWRLTGDAKGASCERTDEPADLELSVRELGAAYLGGVSLTALAAGGRVREAREGALAEAAVAFGSAVAPWLPHSF
ncbi:GNAT family N-acetyltransferase [Streptomyces varsoviensis]|uniref:GNAT family N-acetyltransferase n=1 Tax=Streptomyces varsoviensis TaxID=67373 RepID=UPI0033F1F435